MVIGSQDEVRLGENGAKCAPAVWFEVEYQKAHRSLWLLAMALAMNRHDADDILQEAVLAAYQKLDKFEQGTSFRAWLASFVRFVAMNWRRRRRKHAAAVLDAGGLVAPAGKSAVGVGAQQVSGADQQHLDDGWVEALGGVEPTARACLLMRVLDELSYREIAECMGIPEGTAMSHVFRTKAALRALVRAPSGAGSSGAGSSGGVSPVGRGDGKGGATDA